MFRDVRSWCTSQNVGKVCRSQSWYHRTLFSLFSVHLTDHVLHPWLKICKLHVSCSGHTHLWHTRDRVRSCLSRLHILCIFRMKVYGSRRIVSDELKCTQQSYDNFVLSVNSSSLTAFGIQSKPHPPPFVSPFPLSCTLHLHLPSPISPPSLSPVPFLPPSPPSLSPLSYPSLPSLSCLSSPLHFLASHFSLESYCSGSRTRNQTAQWIN